MKQTYQADTAGSIMSTTIPICNISDTCAQALIELGKDIEWDDIHHVYLIDDAKDPRGYARIADIVQQPSNTRLENIIQKFPVTLRVNTDQEEAVHAALKNDLDAIPVINDKNDLVGAVTAKSIIDVLHNEHVEDVLFAAGIRRSKDGAGILRLASARLLPVFKARAPWLALGAVGGVLLGIVPSHFEATLQETIELAFFIPVVAYIAASVGTQAEAITVRALAIMRVRPALYLAREIAIGFLLGLVLGSMAGLGALLISQDPRVASVVAAALVTACTVATGMSSLIAITFKALGKDPALGSGPIATALQDILSILIYFVFAKLIIGG